MTQQPSSPHAPFFHEPHAESAPQATVLAGAGQLCASEVLATSAPAFESLRLAPHPTAPRASRNFVSRTLLDWQLSRVIQFACPVVSELVASSSVNAGTDMDVSVTWSRGVLRIAVQDGGPALLGQPPVFELQGRGLRVVAGLSRAFGVLPTGKDGGKVVWAVLNAPRTPPAPTRDSGQNLVHRAAGVGVLAT